jgi:hypothetical protein
VRVALLEKQDAMTGRTTVLMRVKKLATFVAIVWGVAGSFVLFDFLAMSGAERVAESSDAMDALSLPEEVRDSVTCGAPHREGQNAPAATPVVQAAAWSFGVQVGARARWTEILADAVQSPNDPRRRAWLGDVRRMVQQTDAEVARLASSLGVPRPTAFSERNSATAFREFVTFVEADAQATARTLAGKHSSQVCEAYKIGEYWGYSMMMRDVLPGERNIFAAEIAHYAGRLQLPEPLWRPMVARTPANATTDQLSSETVALTDALTRHFSAGK